MRLQITRRAELAIRTLEWLNAQEAAVDLRHVASFLKIPVGSVPQIVRPLTEAGWLSFDPDSETLRASNLLGVSLFDVVAKVDGPNDLGRCVLSDCACTEVLPCKVQDAWMRARVELIEALKASPICESVRADTVR